MKKIIIIIILFLMVFFVYGEVKNPDRPFLLIKNHHLYMSVEDDDGEISIVKYKISLPGH